MTAEKNDAAIDECVDACRNSPAEFARVFFGVEPTTQQLQLMDAVAIDGSKVAVASGHGTGKSTSLAIIALWFLTTRKDALIPCTAPTAHQLQDVLWREMRRMVSLAVERHPELEGQYSINEDQVHLKGSAGMIVARTARPENPDALQGFHAENILFLIDEAAGVADSVFQVAGGALSTPNARVVMTANPTQLTGYFHKAFNKDRDLWTRLKFSCLDSSLVAPNYAPGVAAEYGEDSDVYRIRVLGEFPKQGLTSIIPMERVQAAFAKTLPVNAVDYAPVILGVDPAWEGSDRSCIFMRQGIWAKCLLVRRGLRGDELAERVVNFTYEYKADHIFVDKGGVGASCCDFLRSSNISFIGVSFAESPSTDGYLNRRVEMWWRMREWFMEEVAVERNDDLLQDLIGPEYGRKDNGKIYLESKEVMRKRGLASPDLGDALALTFAMPVYGKGHRVAVHNTFSKKFNPYAGLERR